MILAKIEEGTVIDHIPPQEGFKLIPLLKLDQLAGVVTLGMNLSSGKLGEKDMITVEERFFTPEELNQIALFAPEATISIIKQGKVKEKFKVTLPERIEGILLCKNTNCVTQTERVRGRFTIQKGSNNLFINCDFCGSLCRL